MSDFGVIWRRFREYLQIKTFFQKVCQSLALSLYYFYSPLTSCKKSEKSLEPFLRKLRHQPTNQPTNHYQQHRFYRTQLAPVQKRTFNLLTHFLKPDKFLLNSIYCNIVMLKLLNLHTVVYRHYRKNIAFSVSHLFQVQPAQMYRI